MQRPSKSNITGSKALLFTGLFLIMGFAVVQIVYAATPNPGHTFTSVSGGIIQGDLLFGSDTDVLSALAKNATATRYLSNTGTDNNPAWAQVDLTNGINGNLPVGNLNGGVSAGATTYWRGDATWTQVDLGTGVSGTLPVTNLDEGTNASTTTFWRGDATWATPVYRSIIGGASSASVTATAVCNPNGYSVCNTTVGTLFGVAMPYNATIKNLYAWMATAPAALTTCAFTIRSSASCTGAYASTPVTCTVTGNGSLRNCSDTSNTANISAGSCIQIYYVETGTCTGIIGWGFEVNPQ